MKVGGRVQLSPEAQDYFNSIAQHHGGQTRLLENAIEFYVRNRVPQIENDLQIIKDMLIQIILAQDVAVNQKAVDGGS